MAPVTEPRADRPARTRIARGVCVTALAAEGTLLLIGLHGPWRGHVARTELWAAAACVAAVVALRFARFPARRAALLVVGAGILFQAVALSSGPVSSDDVYRYVWDGKVQLSGTDPYRFPPSSEAVSSLRSPELFGPGACSWKLPDGTCTRINRPTVRTIYPPVAEADFTLGRLVGLDRTDATLPQQLLAALAGILTGLVLVRRSLSTGRPMWQAALWAWCPVTVIELGNNGHVDGLAVLLSVLALTTAARGRITRSGLWLGAAIATKLYPAILLPVLVRRRPVRMVAAAASVVLAVYLPHVIAVGLRVLGYLPGYLKEEGYDSGGRFLLLMAPFGHIAETHHPHLFTAAAVLIAAAAAVLAAATVDATRPELTAVWLVAVFLLVSTPRQSWYALLLLALVALSGRIEWSPLAIMPTFAMLMGKPWGHWGQQHFGFGAAFPTVCYGIGLVAGVVGLLVRRRTNYQTSVASSAIPSAKAT